MNDILEQEDSCCMEMSDESSHSELCCCYVEMDDGSYENPCDQPIDEYCC